jgi:tRNA threonylcarbamoyladenosine biosynthesis protein TsaE
MSKKKESMNSIKEVINHTIAKVKKNNDDYIILLQGTLGSGKTYFVKEYIARMSNSNENVTSATFSIVHEYSNNIFHYDLYRKTTDEIMNNGILEMITGKGIHFIEWPDKQLIDIIKKLKIPYLNINILVNGEKREYEIHE